MFYLSHYLLMNGFFVFVMACDVKKVKYLSCEKRSLGRRLRLFVVFFKKIFLIIGIDLTCVILNYC